MTFYQNEVAPIRFCINDEGVRGATLGYIGRIENALHNLYVAVHVDLSKIEFASAAASVLLFAVLSRANFILGSQANIRISLPKKDDNPNGYRWIVSTGLGRALLATSDEKLKALVQQKRYFQSSIDPELALTTTMEMLRDKAMLSHEQETLLMMGINEAMLNVRNHAYENATYTEIVKRMGGKRWWQCSWFDKENDRVVFIICDLGMGISESYSNVKYNYTTQFILEQNQVAEALTSGNSRYRKAGRGNGSEDIKRPVSMGKTKNEKLKVLTQNCLYEFDTHSNGGRPVVTTLKPSIPGTIVYWTLSPIRG